LTQTIRLNTPRWGVPFLESTDRYFCAYGGRGSGKSHFFAEMLVERCVLKQTNAVCVREVQKSLNQSVKKLLEIKIEALGVGHLFDVQRDKIVAPHGGVIIFQGLQNHTADSIKSLEGFDIAWIEEAQSISQISLDLLRPTIRKEGSQIWATWNPNNAKDAIDKLFRADKVPTDSLVVQVNFADNPWFPDVLRKEMEYDRSRDIDKYNHIWLGAYAGRTEARVFKNWVIEEFETAADAIFKFGGDWGFSVDPTVLVRSYIVGRKLYIDYEAYQVGCEIHDTPDLFLTVPESEKWTIVADSARPETISHMRNNGFPKMLPAIKGAGSIEDGIEFLKSFDIVVHPRCSHVIDELTHYSFKIDPKTDEILPVLEDKNNHVIDSLRYACEAVRRTSVSKAVKLNFTSEF
jgi:phage terminase large subunit